MIFLNMINFKWGYKLRNYMLEKVYKVMINNEGRPDIIYAHYLPNIFNAICLKEKYNIPLVGIEHWSVLNQLTISDKVKYLGDFAYPKTDKLLVVSNALSKSIEKHFGIYSVVVNDMVGNEFLLNDNTFYKKNTESFHFLAIGSLIPRKGFDILIEAFHKSGLAKHKCNLDIIGGGNEQDKLQEKIGCLLLQESVKLIGRKNKQEIIAHLQNSHTFVLSSHVETFSVVCIEAMSQGIPVIATACGGPEEFVTKDVGILVKPSDVDALANAMIQMYENYHMYNNEKIAEYCRSKFAPEVIAKQLTSIFEEVVSNNKENK